MGKPLFSLDVNRKTSSLGILIGKPLFSLDLNRKTSIFFGFPLSCNREAPPKKKKVERQKTINNSSTIGLQQCRLSKNPGYPHARVLTICRLPATFATKRMPIASCAEPKFEAHRFFLYWPQGVWKNPSLKHTGFSPFILRHCLGRPLQGVKMKTGGGGGGGGHPAHTWRIPGHPAHTQRIPGHPAHARAPGAYPAHTRRIPGAYPGTRRIPSAYPGTRRIPGHLAHTRRIPGHPAHTRRIPGAYPGTQRIPGHTRRIPGHPAHTRRIPGAYPGTRRIPGAYPAHTRAPGAYPDGHHLQYSGSLFPSTLRKSTQTREIPKNPRNLLCGRVLVRLVRLGFRWGFGTAFGGPWGPAGGLGPGWGWALGMLEIRGLPARNFCWVARNFCWSLGMLKFRPS